MSPEQRVLHCAGFGLPAAIFVITVLALIIASISALTLRSAESVATVIQSQRAFYSAESGIQLALNLLLPPDGSAGRSCTTAPFYTQTFSVAGLNGCSVSVSCRSVVDGSQSFYFLTSSGSCGSGREQAQRQLEVMAQ